MAAGNQIDDLIEINVAIARARLNLREYSLALVPVLLAKKMARDIKGYQYLGSVYYLALATMYYTNQFDGAVAVGYEYFEAVPPAYRKPGEEGKIWHGLGYLCAQNLSDHDQAVEAYTRAVNCLKVAGDSEYALRSACAMAASYTSLKRFDLARKCIYRCMLMVRALPLVHWGREMIHLRRAQLAYAEADAGRAMVLAHRCLQRDHGHGFEDMRFDALMLLHRLCWDLQEYKDALGYALAARVAALDARVYWREYEAAEAMMNTIQVAGSAVVSELDQEYLATGVDMTRYVPETILRARD